MSKDYDVVAAVARCVAFNRRHKDKKLCVNMTPQDYRFVISVWENIDGELTPKKTLFPDLDREKLEELWEQQ